MTGGGVDEEEADKYLHSLYQAHYFALFLKLFFSAAKRSSTPALVPESVCSSVVKPDFLPIWSPFPAFLY